MKAEISGVYAITPDEDDTEKLLEKVHLAITGGVRLIQYRNKSADEVTRLWQANALASFAKSHDITLIINDSISLACSTNADGVHLGEGDGDVVKARKALPDKLIGVSCYNDLERAIAAEKAGADYVAFGAAFPSATKPNALQASIDLYKTAKEKLSIPVVAIGGINMGNAKILVNAGVDAIAIIAGLFETNDICASGQYFSNLFKEV